MFQINTFLPHHQHPKETQMESWYWLLTKILGSIGLMLITLTLIIPYWMKLVIPCSNTTLVLWSICVDKICTKPLRQSELFLAYRILIALCVFCGMGAVATSFVSRLRTHKLPVITNVFTGILLLITMLLYGLWMRRKLIFEETGLPLAITFSWSFIMGCLGCSMFIICGFLHILIEIQTASRIHPKSNMNPLKKDQGILAEGALDLQQAPHSLV